MSVSSTCQRSVYVGERQKTKLGAMVAVQRRMQTGKGSTFEKEHNVRPAVNLYEKE